MLTRTMVVAILGLLLVAGTALAADKEVAVKLVSVDTKKMTLTVITENGKKTYDVNDETRFVGPNGGVSDKGIKDDRLARYADLKLVIADNNRTLLEVHLPERKAKDK